MSFDDLNISDEILRGIYAYGWEKPSLIQQEGIPLIIKERDVIIQAQSGLGKTGTFSISTLQVIDPNEPTVQGVIILNTRELADQVYNVIREIGRYIDVNFIKCVGGARVDYKFPKENRATVLIGTPGKISSVLDPNRRLIHQRVNNKIVVIDEFDKTLEVDFIPTIKQIFRYTNDMTKIVLVSATINHEVREFVETFMKNPKTIIVKDEELSLEGIKQYHILLGKEEYKFETVIDLYKSILIAQSIIFVNSKWKCEQLEQAFTAQQFTINSLHGGMEQAERDTIMKKFRNGEIRILLSTDLTARGIDVPSISLVINYDLPTDKAQYIHRVGRTGRYGKKGVAINLIGHRSELTQLKTIEDYYSVTIPELPNDLKSLFY